MRIVTLLEQFLTPRGEWEKFGQHYNLSRRIQKLYSKGIGIRSANALSGVQLARELRKELGYEAL